MTQEMESFPCPHCERQITRPIGAITFHSCDNIVPATEVAK